MKEKAYYEKVNVKNETLLRNLLQKMPPYCKQFFIGIEPTTSSRTRIAYAYDLNCFFDYLHENNPLCSKKDITEIPLSVLGNLAPMDIEEYLSYLKYYEKDGVEHTNDERGLKRKLASLRSFYRYLYKNEMIGQDPAVKVDMPKIHEKTITRLDIDEVANLLDEVESGESLTEKQQKFHEKTKTRDLAMMTLLLGTGIRVSECVGLDMDDVDFKNNGIKIHRKGGAEVVVYFGEEVRSALMEYMVSANLAFQTKDRIPDIYEHWIARDFFTYIRIAQGSDSRADFLSIMNRPKRYIGRDSLPDETVCFDEWVKLYEEQPWIAERIEKLWYDLKHLSRLSPYAAINYIRRGIGYDDYLAEYAEYRNANKEDFYEVADEILASAKGYRTFEEWFAHIEEYRQELKRLAQEKRRNQNAVTFATLHSAKGLEFTKVYLIDVNEGVMPYKKAVLKQDVEEERRLFYVGMTRAKESLTICSVKKMRGKEVELSRFIKEVGKEP